MDQNLNNSQNDFLWTLLANPANDARLYAYNLRRLVDDFPQSGILQALLAHASDEKNLKQASAYFNARSLYKLINAPSSLAPVADEKIIKLNGSVANGNYQNAIVVPDDKSEVEVENQSVDVDRDESETYFSENSAIETDADLPLLAEDHHPATEPEVVFSLNETTDDPDTTEIISVAAEEPGENIAAAESRSSDTEAIQDEPIVENTPETNRQIEQPVNAAADELITGADTDEHIATDVENQAIERKEDETIEAENLKADPQVHQTAEAGHNETQELPDAAPKETTEDKLPLPALNDEEDKLIVGNIAATDFFMFDKAFGEKKEEENAPPISQDTPAKQTAPTENNEHQDLSKYNDEKMPYTFMWWLDKTRKEHAGVNQPYTKPETVTSVAKRKNVTDELQQQYFENIFHITSVDDLDKHTAPKVFEFGVKRKEQVIIERFIKEEPQIKAQSGDKLDNENKAKKSSEDRDELVTETLAAVYADQMLYHKAIASYKKLVLKYPEKSRYFAGKIEQLEKKTN